MKVLLHGCNGRMGQVMTQVISKTPHMEVVAGVDIELPKGESAYPVYTSLDDVREAPDVLVDFSFHLAVGKILSYGKARGVPLVICTTGHTAEEKKMMEEASKDVAVLHSANMSLGVNIVLSLAKKVAEVAADMFDIEIIEKHHNQKVDAPSGTALMIADELNLALDGAMVYRHGRHGKTEKRRDNEIGIHAVRGGAIVGEHTIVFAGQGEVIEIKHSALSRNLFAYGAVKAVQFICGMPSGFYTMADVIEKGR